MADGLSGLKLQIPAEPQRSPHILSLGFPGGLPADLAKALANEQIFGAVRLGRLRISPHVYNDEADVDRFVAFMKTRLSS